MNEERSFERFVADKVAGTSQGIPLPDDFYDDMHSIATTTRQRPEWLALIKEPPMRTNSRVAVGSPTVRVAAIMAATLLLIVAMAATGAGVQRLLAADSTIIVDQSGAGDYTTIAAAVVAAGDGDTIMVRPGNYTDALYIDKDIAVVGDGPREDIVIGGSDASSAIAGSDCENEFPCVVVFDQSNASLSNVTFRGSFAGVGVAGGAPTIEGVLFDQDIERLSDDAAFSGVVLSIVGDSAARIIGNEFIGDSDLTIQDGANPLIEGNTLDGWGVNASWPGDDAILRGNEISGSRSSAISIHTASTLLIEDNIIRDVPRDGILADFNGARGFDPVIRGNTISGSEGSGIAMGGGANPTIESNSLVDNRFGIFLQVGDAIVRDNGVSGGAIGLVIAGGGTPQITDNTIGSTDRGITITNGSQAILTGNTVCGEGENISVDDRSEPSIDDTNTQCEPEAIIVDQSGAGDYTTLAEAVAVAEDGNEILIRPGAYTEAIVIEADLAISGDGRREDIVISGYQDPELWAPGSECFTSEPGACAIVLSQTETTLSDITLSGPHSGIKIMGGAPTVSGVMFDQVGNPTSSDTTDDAGLAMSIDGGSAARILNNEFVTSADLEIYGRAIPLIEGNSLRDGSRIMANDPGDETIIRANEIADAASIAININAATRMLIEGNVITGSGQDGIQLGLFSAIGIEPVIRGNTISGSGGSAVNGVMGGAPSIEGNTFSDNATGLLLGLGQAQVLDNGFSGEGTGITVARGSDPTITGNAIDVSGVGINLGDGARGTLSENVVCGGEAAISIHENAGSSVGDDNETC